MFDRAICAIIVGAGDCSSNADSQPPTPTGTKPDCYQGLGPSLLWLAALREEAEGPSQSRAFVF